MVINHLLNEMILQAPEMFIIFKELLMNKKAPNKQRDIPKQQEVKVL